MNAFVLAGLILASTGFGFIFRSNQLKSQKRKVVELEREMLLSHAEILELQKKKGFLELRLRELSIPVIPMNSKDEIIEKRRNS